MQEQQEQNQTGQITVETDGISDITTLPASRPQNFAQPSTAELLVGQANLSQLMNEHFMQLSQQLQKLETLCQGTTGTTEILVNAPVPESNEILQKKAELQGQSEQIQAQMQALEAQNQEIQAQLQNL
jgi:hypothetical protein